MNCQLYSGWRLGKRKPGIISDGEGLVEAAGESIEIGGVGLRRGVGVGSGEGDCASVFDLAIKPFGRRQLDSERVAGAMSGKVEAIHWARALGAGLDQEAKNRLEAWGRDDGVFISLSPSLATSVAEVRFVTRFFFPGPEPAACA